MESGSRVAKVMKPASKKVSTYLRDSNNLIEILESYSYVKPNEYLFNTDAFAMYPNIDREEAIATLQLSFETNLV